MKKIVIVLITVIVIVAIVSVIWILSDRKNEKVNLNIPSIDNSFELIFENGDSKDIKTVIKNGETAAYDYSIYTYGGSVKIKLGNEILDLRDAILNNKINMEDIIQKCKKDVEENKIKSDMYMDGGSMEYRYEDYWIIKANTLDGNKDVYISRPNILFDDIKKAVNSIN